MTSHAKIADAINFLAVFKSPERHDAVSSPRSRWRVAANMSSLLRAAEHYRTLSRVEAQATLSNTNVSLVELEERSLIRWVLGETHIPFGVGVFLAGRRRSGASSELLTSEEVTALKNLSSKIYEREDEHGYIEQSSANNILSNQAITELVRHKLVRRVGSQLVIPSHGFSDALRAQVAAAVWEDLADLSQDRRWSRWRQCVPSRWWVNVPRHLEGASQATFFDAALAQITSETDLRGWATEVQRIQPDLDWPPPALESPPLPDDSGYARYKWWREAKLGRQSLAHRARDELSSLISSIVKFDPLVPAPGRLPKKRIFQLLVLSKDRPYLAIAVPDAIVRLRPEALALLATAPETSSLALSLIDQINVQTSAFLNAQLTAQRTTDYRLAAWRELLPLFLDSLQASTTARPLLELIEHLQLQLSATSTTIWKLEEQRCARIQLDELCSLGKRGTVNTSGPSGKFLRNLLDSIEPRTLIEQLDRTSHGRHWPLKLQLAIRLFKQAVDLKVDTLAVPCAEKAIDLLLFGFERLFRSGRIPEYWLDTKPELLDCDWHLVYLALPDRRSAILNPLDFESAAREIQELERDTDEQRDAFDTRTRTLILKKRLHLRILLRIDSALSSHEPITESARQGLREELWEAISVVLLRESGKQGRLFDPSLPQTSAETAELLNEVVRFIESLDPSVRDSFVDGWLDLITNPAVLLSILAVTSLERLRQAALKRVEALDVEEAITDSFTIPLLLAVAKNAALAGSIELADKALAYGDEVAHPSVWHEMAFSTRLLVASTTGDRDAVEAIPLPTPLKPEHETARNFYLASACIDSDPEGAVDGFVQLLEQGFDPVACGVNLFAARNRVAAALDEKSRQQLAFAEALAEWTELESRLSNLELSRIPLNASFNTLTALRGASRTDAFWNTWYSLSRSVRALRSFTQLAVAFLKDEQRPYDVARLLMETASFHGTPQPRWLVQLEADIESGISTDLATVLPTALSDSQLRLVVSEARSRSPETRVRVFGSDSSQPIGEFLLQQHIRAGRILQRLEGMLASLRDEDKYSDVMIALLKAQLDFFSFSVSPQSRGGLTDSTTRSTTRGGVGERDWVIESGDLEIAIAEALRLDRHTRKAIVEGHLTKLVHWYDRTGNPFAFVVLYLEELEMRAAIDRYLDMVRDWAATNFHLRADIIEREMRGAFMKLFESNHIRSTADGSFKLFHLVVRVAERTA